MTVRPCVFCDTPIPSDAAFCPNCGAATPTDLNIEFGEGFEDRLKAALSGGGEFTVFGGQFSVVS